MKSFFRRFMAWCLAALLLPVSGLANAIEIVEEDPGEIAEFPEVFLAEPGPVQDEDMWPDLTEHELMAAMMDIELCSLDMDGTDMSGDMSGDEYSSDPGMEPAGEEPEGSAGADDEVDPAGTEDPTVEDPTVSDGEGGSEGTEGPVDAGESADTEDSADGDSAATDTEESVGTEGSEDPAGAEDTADGSTDADEVPGSEGFIPDIMLFADSSSEPTYDGTNNVFYANGVPITIEDNGAGTVITWDGSITPPINVDAETIVFGGGDVQFGSTSVTMSGGTVKCIYGGGKTGAVTGTATVIINGGTVTDSVYGGGYGGSAAVGATDVWMRDGQVGYLYGGGYSAQTGSTSVNVSGGEITMVYGGGNDGSATVNSASVVVSDSPSLQFLIGGGNSGEVGSTDVTVSGGTFRGVYGGSQNGNVGSTSVTFAGGTATWVYGGCRSGAVTGSATVSVTGGTISSNVYGGGGMSSSSVGSTTVTVQGGIMRGIFGGGENGTVSSANLVIEGPADRTIPFVCGGGYNGATGNTNVQVESQVKTLHGGNYNNTGAQSVYVQVSGESSTQIGSIKQLLWGDNTGDETAESNSSLSLKMTGGRVSQLFTGRYGSIASVIIDGGNLSVSNLAPDVTITNSAGKTVYPVVIMKQDSGSMNKILGDASQVIRVTLNGSNFFSMLSEKLTETPDGIDYDAGRLTLYLPGGTLKAGRLVVKVGDTVYKSYNDDTISDLHLQNALALNSKNAFTVYYGAKDNVGGTVFAETNGTDIVIGDTYPANTPVKFTQVPSSGYQFVRWWLNGEPIEEGNLPTAINDDLDVRAEFTRISEISFGGDPLTAGIVSVTVNGTDKGTSTTSGLGKVNGVSPGQKLVFSQVNQDSNYDFVSWRLNGTRVENSGATYAWTATDGGATIVAEYVTRTALNTLLAEAAPIKEKIGEPNGDYSGSPNDVQAFETAYTAAAGLADPTSTPTQGEIDSAEATLRTAMGKIYCKIKLPDVTGGKVTASSVNGYAKAGETVTLTVTPDPGYSLGSGSLTVKKYAGTDSEATVELGGIDTDATRTFTMPAAAVTVSAVFEATGKNVTFSITSEDSGAGSRLTAQKNEEAVGATSPVNVTVNDTIVFTATAGAMYSVDEWTITAGGKTETVKVDGDQSTATYTLQNVTVETNVTVSFKLHRHKITIATPANGSIAINLDGSVEKGEDNCYYGLAGKTVTLTVTPDTRYELASLTYTKMDNGYNKPFDITKGSGTYSFPMPDEETTVTASFVKPYKITAKNSSEITKVEVDGIECTPDAGASWTAKSGQKVTVTANKDGYTPQKIVLRQVTDDATVVWSVELQPTVDGTFQFAMPSSDVTIEVTFEAKSFEIKTVVNTNGKLDGTGGTVTVDAKAQFEKDVTFTVTPNEGYQIAEPNGVKVTRDSYDGSDPGPLDLECKKNEDGSYSFKMDRSVATITVEFVTGKYAISTKVSPENAGTVSVTASDGTDVTEAAMGTEITVTTTGERVGSENYQVKSLTVKDAEGNGVTVTEGTDASEWSDSKNHWVDKHTYTFKMPAQAVTVSAEFEEKTEYNISVDGGNKDDNEIYFTLQDDLSATRIESAQPDKVIEVHAKAADGQVAGNVEVAVKIKGTNTSVNVTESGNALHTFTMPHADVSVSVKFLTTQSGSGDQEKPGEPNPDTGISTSQASAQTSDTPQAAHSEPVVTSKAVAATSTVVDGTVNVAVTVADINNAVAEALKGADSVALTLEAGTVSGASGEPAQSFSLPVESVKAIAENSKVESLTVKTTTGVSLSLSKAAINAVTAAAGTGGDVQIIVTPVTGTAKNALGIEGGPVYSFEVKVGEKNVTQFGDKALALSIPYTLGTGETADNVKACYIPDSGGSVEILDSTYNKTAKTVEFTTSHLSFYGVMYLRSRFADVSQHWAKDAIAAMEAMGLVNGVTETEFKPDMSLQRGMLVTILGRMSEVDADAVVAGGFTDVAPGAYYAPYIGWAKAAGLAEGTGGGRFSPDAPITREQLAAMLYRYAVMQKVELPAPAGREAFNDDGTISPWAKEAVYAMREAGILNGMGENTFQPQAGATRAQVCTMLVRLMDLMKR